MQGLTVVVAILASLSAINASTFGLGNKIACLHKAEQFQSRVFEDEIKKALEEFREQLKTEGVPEIGLPPVDPYALDNERFQLNKDEINLDLNLTTLVNGLAGYEVAHVKMSLIGLKFEIDLLFPEISAIGQYGLQAGTSLAPFQIFGNGEYDAKATNLLVQAKGKVGTKVVGEESHIILEKLTADLTLDEMNFKITGLLGSDEISEVVSGSVSKGMPQVLKDMKDQINAGLKIIVDKVNDIIINSRSLNVSELNFFNTMC